MKHSQCSRYFNELRMCCWNIAGVRDKMCAPDIFSFVNKFHIVWLLEIKTTSCIGVPGFHTYHNPSKYAGRRGGVAMLVKYSLLKYVKSVNTSTEGQIWIEFLSNPDIMLGGVYIPPADSPYFQYSCFGNLGAVMNENHSTIVLGDFNSRVGRPVLYDQNLSLYEYDGIVDTNVNENGRLLLSLCRGSSMAIGNHLTCQGKNFGGGLTFRRGASWISEIDICLVKEKALNYLKSVEVNQYISGSDHAPLMVELNLPVVFESAPELLLERCSNLGSSCYDGENKKNRYMMKSPSYKCVDLNRFRSIMNETTPPDLQQINSEVAPTILEDGNVIINEIAKQCKLPLRVMTEQNEWDRNHPRWKRIFDANDSKIIWRAINWKGQVVDGADTQPSDIHFKMHFEKLFNPPSVNFSDSVDVSSAPYIPILDDPFTIQELDIAVKGLKKDKSYIGLCPGLFAVLPLTWLTFFLTMFNFLLCNVMYPFVWCHNKFVALFKSGDKLDCGNYRGISIMNTLAKIYDLLLMNRLTLWCNIDKCQAGAQKKRGCVEQIVALRLLMDLAAHKKYKLYVLFVDFIKAYDRVPRNSLIQYLKSLGCGKMMLLAIDKIYSCTRSVLKSATITSAIGIRQGAPTSCLLFVIYIDKMVRMIKEKVGIDGFLGNMHTLLMMDDTVIMSTSREKMVEKLEVLVEYCHSYGMVINEKKTKFFVVNGNDNDRQPIHVRNITIEYTRKYLYLGGWFTDNAKIRSVLEEHEVESTRTINKFAIFCHTNTTMPYSYKVKVFKAALSASLLYSSESWFTMNVTSLERLYNRAVRCLLGVRNNTPIFLCLVEAGLETFIHEVNVRRKNFLTKKMQQIDLDEPFHYIFDLCRGEYTPGYRFLSSCITNDLEETSLSGIKNAILNKPEYATKYWTYKHALNKPLAVHKVYSEKEYVPDYLRLAFTRLRTMSHDLRIETGRWSRTPRESRVCTCNPSRVQNEEHVLTECPLSLQIRRKYTCLNFTNMETLMTEDQYLIDLCKFIYEVLKLYKQ